MPGVTYDGHSSTAAGRLLRFGLLCCDQSLPCRCSSGGAHHGLLRLPSIESPLSDAFAVKYTLLVPCARPSSPCRYQHRPTFFLGVSCHSISVSDRLPFLRPRCAAHLRASSAFALLHSFLACSYTRVSTGLHSCHTRGTLHGGSGVVVSQAQLSTLVPWMCLPVPRMLVIAVCVPRAHCVEAAQCVLPGLNCRPSTVSARLSSVAHSSQALRSHMPFCTCCQIVSNSTGVYCPVLQKTWGAFLRHYRLTGTPLRCCVPWSLVPVLVVQARQILCTLRSTLLPRV